MGVVRRFYYFVCRSRFVAVVVAAVMGLMFFVNSALATDPPSEANNFGITTGDTVIEKVIGKLGPTQLTLILIGTAIVVAWMLYMVITRMFGGKPVRGHG